MPPTVNHTDVGCEHENLVIVWGFDIEQVARFTVSVPAQFLAAVDQTLVKDDNRSALVRRLLERALWEAEEQKEIERYVRGYREQPQTEAELGWSDQVALGALSELPWE